MEYGYKGVKYDGHNFVPLLSDKIKIYEIGKCSYQLGKLKMCKNGIHYVSSLKGIDFYCPFGHNTFFLRVKILGKTIRDNKEEKLYWGAHYVPKRATSKIIPIKFINTSKVLSKVFGPPLNKKTVRLSKKAINKLLRNANNVLNSTIVLTFDTPEIYNNFFKRYEKNIRTTVVIEEYLYGYCYFNVIK